MRGSFSPGADRPKAMHSAALPRTRAFGPAAEKRSPRSRDGLPRTTACTLQSPARRPGADHEPAKARRGPAQNKPHAHSKAVLAVLNAEGARLHPPHFCAADTREKMVASAFLVDEFFGAGRRDVATGENSGCCSGALTR
jgi:hypothetical protein